MINIKYLLSHPENTKSKHERLRECNCLSYYYVYILYSVQ